MKSAVLLTGSLAFLCAFTLCACSAHRDMGSTQPASVPSASPPIPDDVPRAGQNGYTMPQCIHCPDPAYSDEGYRQRIQGEIIMDVVIGVDGRAHSIHLVKSLGHGLDEEAIHAARDIWRFKPALGPNGKPAPVRMLIEINLHLY